MRISTTIAATGLAVTALAAGAPVTAPAAAGTGAAYGGQCGGGYAVVNHFDLPDGRGTVFLAHSPATGGSCVVTVRANPGSSTLMEAFVRPAGPGPWTGTGGDGTAYAGPVRAETAGRCVDWGGTIGTATAFRHGTNCG